MINTCLNSIVNFQIISLKLKKTAAANTSKYTGNDERALVRCIKEYRENYFANEYDALVRLCDDNPYTVDEIFSQSR